MQWRKPPCSTPNQARSQLTQDLHKTFDAFSKSISKLKCIQFPWKKYYCVSLLVWLAVWLFWSLFTEAWLKWSLAVRGVRFTECSIASITPVVTLGRHTSWARGLYIATKDKIQIPSKGRDMCMFLSNLTAL